MKKIIALTLIFVFALSLVSCGTTPTKLGTSALSIVLPEGYALAEDDMDEDQVAYFYKDDDSVDFDVYQWAKGDQFTLESEAKTYAAEYGSTAEAVTVNGLNGYKYVSEEVYDGATYTVLNYMFEDDVYIVELCFWTNASEAEYTVSESIIKTLNKN